MPKLEKRTKGKNKINVNTPSLSLSSEQQQPPNYRDFCSFGNHTPTLNLILTQANGNDSEKIGVRVQRLRAERGSSRLPSFISDTHINC